MERAVTHSKSPSAITLYLADIRKLSRQWRDGSVEAEELVESNLGFVVRVAFDFKNMGLPLEDLVNEGNLGLMEAARRYKPERGFMFSTYAIYWIRKSILRALAEQTRVVRIPGSHLRRLRYLRESGKEGAYRQAVLREVSLEERLDGHSDLSLADRLVDKKASSPEESLIGMEARDLVEQAVRQLTSRERDVIRYRYGLTGKRPLVLRQVGARLGISKERVRQIEARAKDRMRKYITRHAAGVGTA